jgi:hypothetical protein
MATPQQKYAAANAAGVDLGKRDPQLRQKVFSDFIDAGFTYSAIVQADVNAVRVAGYTADAAAFDAYFSDPAAVSVTFDQFGKALGTFEVGANALPGVSQGVVNAAGTALTSLNPLAGLFQANLWIRVGQVALGLILIAVGVAKMTNAVPAATKIARYVK